MAFLRSYAVFVFLLSLLFLVSPIEATNPKQLVVKKGQKIQDYINKADCGTTIIVEKGNYTEQLVIKTDGITLIGQQGVFLLPPPKYTTNECSGIAGNETDINGAPIQNIGQAGICIIGKNVQLYDYVDEHKKFKSVDERVKDVTVTGFKIVGFNGLSIVVVGAKNTHVYKNTLIDGVRYGFLTVGSIDTFAEKNTITCNPYAPKFIALCMDDKSNVRVWDNTLSWYVIGLCVQTNGADVKGNHVSGTCIGANVDSGVVGARLTYNHIRESPQYCGTFLPQVPGIQLQGAQNTLVSYNHIRNISAYGTPGSTGIGIFVQDFTPDPPVQPTTSNGNVVKENFLRWNDLDIKVDSKGSGNVATKNHCTKSIPANACIG